ncbi:MAG: hypothetical protein LBC68_06600 [Prevotellaceae bacterium]|jgi:hypothetical protein|nr:hypothetical protein [Prevotellaceae bacterium]
MKKYYLLFMMLFSILNSYSQNIDAEYIAKHYLFLNTSFYSVESNSIFCQYTQDFQINNKLFSKYINSFSIKLDTLEVVDRLEETTNYKKDNNFYSWIDGKLRYQFYKINFNNIIFDSSVDTLCRFFIGIVVEKKHCIIAIQEATGRTYRIMGFENSDFLSFIDDFKHQYLLKIGKKLNTQTILNYFNVENVDFNCLYKGCVDIYFNNNDSKTPCLKKFNDEMGVD